MTDAPRRIDADPDRRESVSDGIVSEVPQGTVQAAANAAPAQPSVAASTAGCEPVHPQPPTPLAPAPAPRSELTLRLMTASVIIPLVIALVWVGGFPFLVGVIAICLLGIREFYTLIEEKGAHPLVNYGLVAGGVLPIVAYVGTQDLLTLVMTGFLLTSMVVQLSRARVSEAMTSISGTFFGVFYIGWLLSYAILLRDFHRTASLRWGISGSAFFPEDGGRFFLLFAIAAIAACDSGAYFAGRAWGRQKLAPKISPGKTIEGAVGGTLAGGVAGVLMKAIFTLFWPELSDGLGWSWAFIFGILIAVAGIVGDLVESLLKRDAKSKDTGTLLPGMGGVLDRIDSCLLGIPIMYYLLLGYTYLRLG